MENKAFEIVTSNLEPYLNSKGLKLTKTPGEEKTALYMSEDKAVKISFDAITKSFILETAAVTEGEAGEDWQTVAIWLFDPAQHNEKDAKTIAADFEDGLKELYEKKKSPGTSLTRQEKQADKKGKGSNDAAGLISRLSTEFPQLKEPYKTHTELYGELLSDTFLTEHFNPLMKELLQQDKNDKKSKKLFSILDEKYINGDKEVQSIITMTILASIGKDTEEGKRAAEYMSPTLKTAWRYALKYGLKKLNR